MHNAMRAYKNRIALIFSCILLLFYGRGMLRCGSRSQCLPKPLSVISIHGGHQRFGVPIVMRKTRRGCNRRGERERREMKKTQQEELPPEYVKTSSTGFSPVFVRSENLPPYSGYLS